MKIEIVYVWPAGSGDKYVENAWKYLTSYHQCPAGIDHENIVVCNGGQTDSIPDLFKTLPNCRIAHHDNSGFDIGAFQAMSRQSTADLMVFFGVSAYIRGEGWLKRMVDAWQKHGNHQYGVMGNQGDDRYGVFPHIRTNGFWMAPSLLNDYPEVISRSEQRYGFEHGATCLTQWIKQRGLRSYVVTWGEEVLYPGWDAILNGFHQGDQSALIIGDRMTDPPYYNGAPKQLPNWGGNRR